MLVPCEEYEDNDYFEDRYEEPFDEGGYEVEYCAIDEDFADLPEDVVSCLLLNQAYQQDIKLFLAFIANKLCANRAMQEEIRNRDCSNALNSVKITVTGQGSSHPHSMLPFLAPYFKDVKGLHPPVNLDVETKKMNKEINQAYIMANKQWTNNEKSSLKDAVLRNTKKITLAPLLKQKEQKTSELKNLLSPEFARIKKVCEKEIEELTEEIKSVDNKPLDSFILPRESSHEIDWLSISVSLNKTHFQCEIMWTNYLHPSINKNSWNKEEDEMLTKLVDEFGNDWDEIASNLDTGRISWQCLSRYQSELNTQIKRIGPLSKSEAKHVQEVIEHCRIGNFIPWQQIKYFIEGRSMTQIKHYWNKINVPKRGENFTELEDRVLIAAVQKYGTHNWKKVSFFIPGRSNRQCRERYMLRLAIENRKFGNYTPEEDQKIIQLAKEHNCKWVEIEKKMVGRNARQISTRYEYLMKFHNLNDLRGVSDVSPLSVDGTTCVKTPTRRVFLNRRHLKKMKETMISLYGKSSSAIQAEQDINSILKEGCQELRKQLELELIKKKNYEGRGRPKKTEDETEIDREIGELFNYYSVYRTKIQSKACLIGVQEQYVIEAAKKCFSSLLKNRIPESNHLLAKVVNAVVKSKVTDTSEVTDTQLPPVIPPNRATVRGFQGLILQQSHLEKQMEDQLSIEFERSLIQSPDYKRLLHLFISLFIWPFLLSKENAPQKDLTKSTVAVTQNKSAFRSSLYEIRDKQHRLIQSAIKSQTEPTVQVANNTAWHIKQANKVTTFDTTDNEETFGRGKRRKTQSWKNLNSKKQKETVEN